MLIVLIQSLDPSWYKELLLSNLLPRYFKDQYLVFNNKKDAVTVANDLKTVMIRFDKQNGKHQYPICELTMGNDGLRQININQGDCCHLCQVFDGKIITQYDDLSRGKALYNILFTIYKALMPNKKTQLFTCSAVRESWLSYDFIHYVAGPNTDRFKIGNAYYKAEYHKRVCIGFEEDEQEYLLIHCKEKISEEPKYESSESSKDETPKDETPKKAWKAEDGYIIWSCGHKIPALGITTTFKWDVLESFKTFPYHTDDDRKITVRVVDRLAKRVVCLEDVRTVDGITTTFQADLSFSEFVKLVNA